MNWQAILSTFEPTSLEELSAAFRDAKSQLATICDALDAYATSQGTMEETQEPRAKLLVLDEQIASAQWSMLLQIQASMPFWTRRRFRRFRLAFVEQLESIRELTSRPDLPAASRIEELLDHERDSLEQWEERAIIARRRNRLAVAAVGIVAAFGLPAFLFMQYWMGGIQTEHVSFFFPENPRLSESFIDANRLSTRASIAPDREPFLQAFSRFYFGIANDFLDQNYAKASAKQTEHVQLADLPQRRLYQWKVLLSNASVRSPEFISEVRETIQLVDEKKFPWDELSTDPDVEVRIEGGTWQLAFINRGLGPAIRLRWKISQPDGALISQGSQFVLKGHAAGLAPLLPVPSSPALVSGRWNAVALQPPGTDSFPKHERELLWPFELHLDDLPREVPATEIEDLTGDARLAKTHDGYRERITSVRRLSELGEIVIDKLAVSLRYEDLKGDETKVDLDIALPDDLLLLRPSAVLRPSAAAPAAAAGRGRLLFALAHALTPLKTPSPSKETVRVAFDFDLSRVETEQIVGKTVQCDAVLSPNGRISVQTMARAPRTGTYEVVVYVNGTEATKFRIDTFNPELRRFPQSKDLDDPSESQLLRQLRIHEIVAYRELASSGDVELLADVEDYLTIYSLSDFERGEFWSAAPEEVPTTEEPPATEAAPPPPDDTAGVAPPPPPDDTAEDAPPPPPQEAAPQRQM